MQMLLSCVNSRKRAIVALFATALLWSTAGILMKFVPWNGLALAGGRSFFAALVFLLFVPSAARSAGALLRDLHAGNVSNWRLLAAAAAYCGTVSLFVLANKLTTAANAVILQFSAPIYVALFSSWFLKERVTRRDWFAIAAVFCGVGMFFADDLSLDGGLGIACGLLSGACFGTMILLLRASREPESCVFLGNILTVLVGLPFLAGESFSTTAVVAVMLLGMFQLGLGYLLYTAAVRHVSALEAALIPMLEPVLNPIWVALLHGERPGPWAMIGGALVLTVLGMRSVYNVRSAQNA